jgi:ribonuclease VapC
MFLDASVIVAVLTREEGWQQQARRLEALHGRVFHSPMVRFEATIALARVEQGRLDTRLDAATIAAAEKIFDEFTDRLGSQEIDITVEIGRLALQAAQTYGKLVGHKAALNLGDCFSYAAAKSLGVGLFYKGNDFALTDLA